MWRRGSSSRPVRSHRIHHFAMQAAAHAFPHLLHQQINGASFFSCARACKRDSTRYSLSDSSTIAAFGADEMANVVKVVRFHETLSPRREMPSAWHARAAHAPVDFCRQVLPQNLAQAAAFAHRAWHAPDYAARFVPASTRPPPRGCWLPRNPSRPIPVSTTASDPGARYTPARRNEKSTSTEGRHEFSNGPSEVKAQAQAIPSPLDLGIYAPRREPDFAGL